MKLFARGVVLVEQREDVLEREGSSRAFRHRVQHEHVALAGDADHGARHARRMAADHGAVSGRIRPGQRRAGGPRVNRDALLLREFDGLGVEDSGARLGELLRLFVGERADTARRRYDAWIRGVHPVDVGADFAVVGADGGGHRDSRRVAPAAAERRHLAAVGHALITGDDDDLAARELVLHAERTHFDDARVHVAVVRDDAGLAAGEADGVAAQLANRHRQQRHRNPLAGGEQHVQLAPVRIRGDLLRQPEEIVGGVAHRGDDHDQIVTLAPGAHHPIRDLLDAAHVRDARAAVLLDNDRHCRMAEWQNCRKERSKALLLPFLQCCNPAILQCVDHYCEVAVFPGPLLP